MIRIYDGLITILAISAAVVLGMMVFGIALDVVLRNIGLRPVQATSALVEYGMLYATMAGSPWLVRAHGHVAILSFVNLMPKRAGLTIKAIILVASILVMAVLAWRSVSTGLDAARDNIIDIRSIYLPGWVLFAMLAGGFALMGLEFLRLLLRGDLTTGSSAKH